MDDDNDDGRVKLSVQTPPMKEKRKPFFKKVYD